MIRGKTLADICGARWSRLLTPTMAAAYCGMLLPEFMRSRFAATVRRYDGVERVDRFELDAMIDDMRAAKTAAAERKAAGACLAHARLHRSDANSGFTRGEAAQDHSVGAAPRDRR